MTRTDATDPHARLDGSCYVVVTPVRDEAAYVERTFASLIAQSSRPTLWIVVDDGSTDGTDAIVDRLASRRGWIRVLHRPDRGFRAAGGGVMEAFSAGVNHVDTDWDFLVKLDADLSFDCNYFATCLRHFEADPQLGIAGGTVCRLKGDNVQIDSPGDPAFHVRGATKIYRRACWESIAPLPATPGWDTIDEVRANLAGWRTRTFGDATVLQHKPTGAADGRWRNAFKNGRADYFTGYHPLFMAAKCLRRTWHKPYGAESCALAAGYCSGYLARMPRPAGEDAVRYLRKQQMRRLLLRPSIYD